MSSEGDATSHQKEGQDDSKRKVIVNYLPQMTQNEVMALFSSVGEVENCTLMKNKVTGEALDYGFINYYKPEDAEKAINTLNGLRIHYKTIKVSYARPSSESIKGSNLYISGLPKSMNQHDLEALFSPYGKIISSKILCDTSMKQYVTSEDNFSGVSKGVGFIRFNERLEAQRAIQELNGTVLNESMEPITVKFAYRPNKSIYPTNKPLIFQSKRPFVHSVPYSTQQYKQHSVPGDIPANSTLQSSWPIFVYNLASEADENVLWQLFNPFGYILSVKAMRNLQTNKCKGFGFVTMANYDEALSAIQSLNGYMLDNRVLQVSFKTNKYN